MDTNVIVKKSAIDDLKDWNLIIVQDKYIYYKNPKNTDITFIVQGLPRSDTYVKLICNLLKFGHVEISTWDVLDQDEVIDYIKTNDIQNGQNIYLQVYTTLEGIKKCKTKFAIKVRADEWYENFTAFITVMKRAPNKITTHNMFFRTHGQYPYHISDHIIGGTTDNMLKMFTTCKHMLDTKQKLPKIPRMLDCCPEQWLTVAYMKCFYKDEELLSDITKKMMTHFQILPVNLFNDFLLRYTSEGKRYIITGTQELKDHLHAFGITNINNVGI
jgi:hypothetical protein